MDSEILRSVLKIELHHNENKFFKSLAIQEIDNIMIEIWNYKRRELSREKKQKKQDRERNRYR